MERGWKNKIRTVFGAIAMLVSLSACNGNSQTAATTATTTVTYTLTNGVCYVTGTTTVVSTTYCGTTTTTTTTGGSICIGTYYDPRVGIWGTCNGTNCRGMYMYNTSGQLVYCP